MTYSILNSERVEIKGTRTDDYSKALATWQAYYAVMICFLVCWKCKDVFVVLAPTE